MKSTASGRGLTSLLFIIKLFFFSCSSKVGVLQIWENVKHFIAFMEQFNYQTLPFAPGLRWNKTFPPYFEVGWGKKWRCSVCGWVVEAPGLELNTPI